MDATQAVEIDIPEELCRRTDRLAAIARAKAEIEHRANMRYEAEQQEYEEKLKVRQEKESASGKKLRGRPPQSPPSGP